MRNRYSSDRPILDPRRFLRFFNVCAAVVAAAGILTSVGGLLASGRLREFLLVVGVTLIVSTVVVIISPRMTLRRKNGPQSGA